MGYDVKNLWKGNRLQIRYPVIYGGDGTRPSGEPFVLGVQGALGHKQKSQCVHISNVHAGLEEQTIEYLLRYQYGEDLVKKPVEAMQK